MAISRKLNEPEAAEQVQHTVDVANTTRVDSLHQISAIASAKVETLRAELIRKRVKHEDSDDEKKEAQRLSTYKRCLAEIMAEIQRSTVTPPVLNNDAVIFGRVHDTHRLGVAGLRVEAVNQRGETVAFGETQKNGTYELRLDAPSSDAEANKEQVTIRVIGSDDKVVFQGTERHSLKRGKAVFRELAMSATRI